MFYRMTLRFRRWQMMSIHLLVESLETSQDGLENSCPEMNDGEQIVISLAKQERKL